MSGNIHYDPQTMTPKMSIQKAIEEGLLPEDILDGIKRVLNVDDEFCAKLGFFYVSEEALQDYRNLWKATFAVRTPDITAEDVASWYKAEAQLRLDEESIDEKLARLRKLGFSIEDERQNPYEDWEYPELEGYEKPQPRKIEGRSSIKGQVRG